MKKRYSVLTGIAALALVCGLAALTACGNSLLETDGPQSIVLMGTAGGNTYVLEITQNTGRAAYSPRPGDGFTMSIIAADGSEKTCTGTVQSASGSGFTLQPSTPGSSTFTASQSQGGLGGITGAIALDDGTTQSEPASITPCTLDADGEQVYTWEGTGTEYKQVSFTGNATLRCIGGGDPFAGTISNGKLYLSLPASIADGNLDANLQTHLDTAPDSYTYSSGTITVSANSIKFLGTTIEVFVSNAPWLYLNLYGAGGNEDNQIQWIYVDGPTTVDGSRIYTLSDSGWTWTKQWNNVSLQTGWNKVLVHTVYGNQTITETMSINSNTDNYQWNIDGRRSTF